MLTEPVICSTCGAVSVNGGTIHCHRCFQREAEKSRHEAREMKRLLAEMTVAIRNGATTPDFLRGWREKATAYLGAQIVIHG